MVHTPHRTGTPQLPISPTSKYALTSTPRLARSTLNERNKVGVSDRAPTKAPAALAIATAIATIVWW